MESEKIYIDVSMLDPEYLNFVGEYADETLYAMRELQEEYSFKIYSYLFAKLYGPIKGDKNPHSFSLEDLCERVGCTKEEDLHASLDELVEKHFLIPETNENGEIDSYALRIKK